IIPIHHTGLISSGGQMHLKLRRSVISTLTVGAAMAAAMGGAQAASASPAAPVINVPCHVFALASAIGNAPDGATLHLAANCTYELHSALPDIDSDITIEGAQTTIERSHLGSTPSFSILVVDSDTTVTIANVNLRNGY